MADDKKPFWVEAIPHNSAIEKGDNVGYFKHRRIKVGERFQVTEQEFSKKWMRRVSAKYAKLASEESDDMQADESRAGKRSAESVI